VSSYPSNDHSKRARPCDQADPPYGPTMLKLKHVARAFGEVNFFFGSSLGYLRVVKENDFIDDGAPAFSDTRACYVLQI